MSVAARRCWVSGRVQGVWYRGSTARVARPLGILGYAKNLPDGRVEVLAIGETEALDHLQNWLWDGPVSAQVADVVCETLDDIPVATRFETL